MSEHEGLWWDTDQKSVNIKHKCTNTDLGEQKLYWTVGGARKWVESKISKELQLENQMCIQSTKENPEEMMIFIYKRHWSKTAITVNLITRRERYFYIIKSCSFQWFY
jgi:hypothetical protein